MKMHVIAILAGLLSLAAAGTNYGSFEIQRPQGPGKRDLTTRAAPPPKTYYLCDTKNVTFAGCDTDTECQIPSIKRSNIGKVGIPILDVFYTLGDGYCGGDSACNAGVFSDSPVMDMCKETLGPYVPNAVLLNACSVPGDPDLLRCDFLCPDTEERCQTDGDHYVPCGHIKVNPLCQVIAQNSWKCPGTQVPSYLTRQCAAPAPSP